MVATESWISATLLCVSPSTVDWAATIRRQPLTHSAGSFVVNAEVWGNLLVFRPGNDYYGFSAICIYDVFGNHVFRKVEGQHHGRDECATLLLATLARSKFGHVHLSKSTYLSLLKVAKAHPEFASGLCNVQLPSPSSTRPPPPPPPPPRGGGPPPPPPPHGPPRRR